MNTFAIQCGPTPLCVWNLDTGQVTAHKQVVLQDGILVLPEESRVGFVLDPAEEGMQFRISIGDVPLTDITPNPDDASGVLLGGRLFWRDLAYFDSARAHTQIIVEVRPEADEGASWRPVLSECVYILPSKVGEDRYEAMNADLDRVSHSLLSDLYGKSRHTIDLMHAKLGHTYQSREEELRAIEDVLLKLKELLLSIARGPVSRVVTTRCSRRYWGAQHLHPTAIAELARSGTDIRTAPRPVQILARVKRESFDVPEHRIIKAFLRLLFRRCRYCAAAAEGHARAITSEKHLRDIRLGEKPSLYESVDLPRISRLKSASERAIRCEAMTEGMLSLPFFQDVSAVFSIARGGIFQRNNEYRALMLIMQRFLLEHAQWYEGNDYTSITKLTWRIFEQWTFLRVVEAFRLAGVNLREWTDVLRHNLRSRFLIDFDRGLMFEGTLAQDIRLRFRYEPWILGHSSAVQAEETLYRGRAGEVTWCPDIVIECLRQSGDVWVAFYAIVLDCKYTPRVTSQHWSGITKYLEIRSTSTGRQVVKQLWLVSPSDEAGVRSEDPAIDFSASGPTCDENEAVRFRLAVKPDLLTNDPEANPVADGFTRFAQGTLAFLRRTCSSRNLGGAE